MEKISKRKTKRKRNFLIFSTLITLLFLTPSFSKAFENNKYLFSINLWPLFVYHKNKVNHTFDVKLLGPLIESQKNSHSQIFSLRPLISKEETDRFKNFYFLSPLGYYKKNKQTGLYSLRIIPLINFSNKKKETEYYEFFPFFWGKSQNETFGGFFPFYGVIKNRFGAEKITFFLWPLYSHAVYKNYESKSYLWPFFKVISSSKYPEKYKGFKFFPFYKHYLLGNTQEFFILWPLYIKEVKNNKTVKTYYFPFYLEEQIKTCNRKIYLWPFFQKITCQNPYYYQTDSPWPFFRKLKGNYARGWVKGFRIWPFYGYYIKEEPAYSFKKEKFLWPLFSRMELKSKGNGKKYRFSQKNFFFLISFTHKSISYKNKTLENYDESRIFPLFYSFNSKKESSSLSYVFYVIPFNDRGMELNYGPIFQIWKSEKEKKWERSEFLWGLIYREKSPEYSLFEIGPIFRKTVIPSLNFTSYEFLEGLLGAGKIGNHLFLKLFFIPVCL